MSAYPAPLLRRADLDLTYLDGIRPIMHLNHADANMLNLDEKDSTLLPAITGVALVTSLVPGAPGCEE